MECRPRGAMRDRLLAIKGGVKGCLSNNQANRALSKGSRPSKRFTSNGPALVRLTDSRRVHALESTAPQINTTRHLITWNKPKMAWVI